MTFLALSTWKWTGDATTVTEQSLQRSLEIDHSEWRQPEVNFVTVAGVIAIRIEPGRVTAGKPNVIIRIVPS